MPVADPEAMADAIAELLAGPTSGTGPGGAARYGPERLVPPIEAVYREVLDRR